MIHPNNKKCNKYAIIHRNDRYRTVSDELATRERNLYGCEIIHRNLSVSQATEWQFIYNNETPNDLSNLFVLDFTETIEARQQDAIEEYDYISARCTDGIYRTGSVLAWGNGIVRIEVGHTIYRADMDTAEIIAKVDDVEWDFASSNEYDSYLDETEDDYEFSASFGVVA